MPNEIRKFSQSLLRDPLEISIAISKPASGITQGVFFVEDERKNKLIEHLLRLEEPGRRILVFAGTKRAVKDLNSHLKNKGFKSAEIHSDLEQQQREDTLLSFKNASVPILVATDVLSRGIDIKNIEVVINFDVPGDPEDYVHRIGRTARADATGEAFTLVSRMGRKKFDRIEQLMGIKVPVLPLPEGLQSGEGDGRDDNRSRRGTRGGQNVKHRGDGRPQHGRPQGNRHQGGGSHGGRTQSSVQQGSEQQGGRPNGNNRGPGNEADLANPAPRRQQPPHPGQAEGNQPIGDGAPRKKRRNRGGRNRRKGGDKGSSEGQQPGNPPTPPAAPNE